MQYKTLTHVVGTEDDELNELAKAGWFVHSVTTIGMTEVKTEAGDAEVPVVLYLLHRDDTPEPSTRPERRTLGGRTL